MTENILETALSKDTFSVLSAAKGKAYPRDTVKVYTDASIAYEINQLEHQINAIIDDDDRVNELDAEKNALLDELEAGSLTFLLQGHAPGVTKMCKKRADKMFGKDYALKNDPETEQPYDLSDKNTWLNFSYLAEDIVSVTNAAQAVDEHKWTVEEIEELATWLPSSEFDKLFEKMMELTFARDVFDQAVGPDFSQRR